MYHKAINSLLGLLLIAVGGLDSFAEGSKYHDEALYWIKGNVMEVKEKSKSQLPVPCNAKFNKDGREKVSFFSYNESGYPVGYNIALGDSEMTYEVEWNEAKCPKSITFNSTYWPIKGSGTIEFFYGEDLSLPVKAISISENSKKTKKTTVVCEYSNYEFDDNGNWISRNVTETVTQKGKDKTSNFQETRTIKY